MSALLVALVHQREAESSFLAHLLIKFHFSIRFLVSTVVDAAEKSIIVAEFHQLNYV
jgi:hypothetical protein